MICLRWLCSVFMLMAVYTESSLGQTTNTFTKPSTNEPSKTSPLSVCSSGWSDWINRNSPINSDGDNENMTKEEKAAFCPEGKITNIECVDSKEGDDWTALVEATCTVDNGLRCINIPIDGIQPCRDYKIRYQCSCSETDVCSLIPHKCSQICIPSAAGSYTCSCFEGYMLSIDSRTCNDIDECDYLHSKNDCEMLCYNYPGNYSCGCFQGYALNSDGRTCHSIRPPDSVNSICTVPNKPETCTCKPGYEMDSVDASLCDDIDECSNISFPTGCDKVKQKCENTPGSFKCVCKDGYFENTSKICEDIDECTGKTANCQQHCTNTVGSYTCSCDAGYYLEKNGWNCTDVDECDYLHPRNNCEMKCFNHPGNYSCGCYQGYALNSDGRTCHSTRASNISRSVLADCPVPNRPDLCTCKSGYMLSSADAEICEDIDECSNRSYPTGCDSFTQKCENTLGSFKCVCKDGFSENVLKICEDIDECSLGIDRCQKHCDNTYGSYNCSCDAGYTLDKNGWSCTDIDECLLGIHNCKHDQTCNNTLGSYNCYCVEGYTSDPYGWYCIDINECSTGSHKCQQNCKNTIGSYGCSCNAGYQLDTDGWSCIDIDECSSESHKCEQNCKNTIGSYSCHCDTGYHLETDQFGWWETCKDTNECSNNSFPTGCDNVTHKCENTPGSFKCVCKDGFFENALKICEDIDECLYGIDVCDENQVCNNTLGSYNCYCDAGYTSDVYGWMCTDIDECSNNTFPTGCDIITQKCENTPGSFKCMCKDGFFENASKTCQDIDECLLGIHNCQQEEICNNTIGSFNCYCGAGYAYSVYKWICTDVDECSQQTDLCEQYCFNTYGSYRCSCKTGYTLDDNGWSCIGKGKWTMTSPHSPLQIFCLVVNLIVVVLTTLVAFSNLGRQYGFPEAIPGLLRSNLENVSTSQPSPISPPSWIHMLWGVVLIWQILWSLHGVVSIFRFASGFPVYTNPVLLSPLLLLVFMFSCGFNVSWFIFYDRLYTSTSCLFIFLTTFTLWTAYGISLSTLYWNIYRMEKSKMYLEIFLTRTLVQNGLALYAMWGLFVLAFNVAVAVIHNTGPHANATIATIIGTSIIGCGQLIYFIVDVSCLDRYSRYIVTPYVISIVVLAACLFRQDAWYIWDLNFVLLTSLLAFALLAVMMKSAWVAYKVIRNNSGGCDITTSDQQSPVDEAYYLLK